jgi:hypothetical protein
MKRVERFRPSPALVVACLALLVSLGGVGYAAITLPRNSVGSAQVINRSLRTVDFSRKAIAALKASASPLTWRHTLTGPTDDQSKSFSVGLFTLKLRCFAIGGTLSLMNYGTGRYQVEVVKALNDGSPSLSARGDLFTSGGESLLAGTESVGTGEFLRFVVHAVIFSTDGHGLNVDVHLVVDRRAEADPYGSCLFDGIATYAP